MIVVAIIGLLAAISVPNFARARSTSQTEACINNLRQIESAKQQWALENNQPVSATPIQSILMPFLGRGPIGAWPTCPSSGTYSINAVSTAATCSVANHALP
jgi:type II secretory pathway pseudopilin PulG